MRPIQTIERGQSLNEAEEIRCSAFGDPAMNRDSIASRLQQASLATHRSLLTASDLKSIQSICVSHLQNTCELVLAVWYHPAGSQIGQSAWLEGLLCPADGMAKSLQEQLCMSALEATQRNQVVTRDLSESLCLQAMPIPCFPGHCLLAVNAQDDTCSPVIESIIASLLILSSSIGEWAMQRAAAHAAENAKTVAAMIELIGHVQSADDAVSGCQRLANSLQTHLHAEKVVVGLCRRGVTDCRVAAISEEAVIDRFSEEIRLIESVLQESLIRSAGALWPVLDPDNRHALLSHQQLVESGFCRRLISMPISTETGAAIGSILVSYSDQDDNAAELTRLRDAERFLRAAAGGLAGCLSVLQKLADSRWLQWTQWIRKAFTTTRLQAAGWIAGGIAILMLLPIQYTVRCSMELQPVERRYLAAPFAGPLEECLVEPGDIVVKDQLLARMDGREIRCELAEVQASLNKAVKERNTQVSNREFGNAAISGHEIQRLEQRIALLRHRNASLEIRSPADGVVVSGDHREAEGVPLETGQTLFEIAPLDSMVVKLYIPEDDIRHVQEGMTVYVQLEAVPEKSIEATIRSIHPRAELRESDNVFVAKADIRNDEAILRPGMRGSAGVWTGRHLLGWNLFHKPAAWLLGRLGW
jgi:multidrug efflux pump subunit AcrA (membrane-fusion protein)